MLALIYELQNTLGRTEYTLHSIYSIQYTLYSILYTVYSIQYFLYSILLVYTVYSIQYILYSILLYTVYSILLQPVQYFM